MPVEDSPLPDCSARCWAVAVFLLAGLLVDCNFPHKIERLFYTGRKYLADERICVACFRKKNEDKGAYVVWMNTDENNGISDAEIPLPDNVSSFIKVETWIPELPSPEKLPSNIEYDQPRTQLPTSRYEKYIGGAVGHSK